MMSTMLLTLLLREGEAESGSAFCGEPAGLAPAVSAADGPVSDRVNSNGTASNSEGCELEAASDIVRARAFSEGSATRSVENKSSIEISRHSDVRAGTLAGSAGCRIAADTAEAVGGDSAKSDGSGESKPEIERGASTGVFASLGSLCGAIAGDRGNGLVARSLESLRCTVIETAALRFCLAVRSFGA